MNRWSATKAVLISMFMTLFLLDFIVLFTITMKRQIEHMIKHSYIPCDCFKKKDIKENINLLKRKRKKIVPVMSKVRQPIRSMPSSKHGIRSIQKHKMNTD